MKTDLVFRLPSNARKKAFFDPDCYQQGGYILKKFSDGYRYFPLGSQQTYVVRNPQLIELGQHVSTFYWWSRQSDVQIQTNCKIISFDRKQQTKSSHTISDRFIKK
ncbi:hypothetical protein V6C27_02305 [Peptococcaceae bacterium 1198_IL3148]